MIPYPGRNVRRDYLGSSVKSNDQAIRLLLAPPQIGRGYNSGHLLLKVHGDIKQFLPDMHNFPLNYDNKATATFS